MRGKINSRDYGHSVCLDNLRWTFRRRSRSRGDGTWGSACATYQIQETPGEIALSVRLPMAVLHYERTISLRDRYVWAALPGARFNAVPSICHTLKSVRD
jgi:hypothetical protein